MDVRPTSHCLCTGALLGAIVGGLAAWLSPATANEVRASAADRLDSIVVTAKKRRDPVADEKVRTQVETALHSNPYFFDEHITVTIINGAVHLQGMVFDDWDRRQAWRLSRRIPGVNRVVNELEIISAGGE